MKTNTKKTHKPLAQIKNQEENTKRVGRGVPPPYMVRKKQ